MEPIETAPAQTDVLVFWWEDIDGELFPTFCVACLQNVNHETANKPHVLKWTEAHSYPLVVLAHDPTHWCQLPEPPTKPIQPQRRSGAPEGPPKA